MSESARDLPAETGDTPDPLAFSWRFLAPRYWGTWLLLGFLRLLMFAPRRSVMHLGAWVGDQFRKRNAKRRRIAEVNLDLCFPGLSQTGREQLLVEHFRAYGRGILDMGLMMWGSEKRLRNLVDLEGFEAHRRLAAEERVLVITWHLTTMEVTGAVMALVGPSISMMKPIGNPLLNRVITRGRRHRADISMLTRDEGMRPMIRGLRSGRQGYLVPDEDFGGGQAEVVFVPFFDIPRAQVTTPSRIARAAGARVSVCASRLDPVTGRYHCTISPPLEGVTGEDPSADTQVICQAMEELVRQAPEQYLWTFRWFRSRPDGGESPYDPVPPG
jgi:lauroyl/myristoyl acyltransferase